MKELLGKARTGAVILGWIAAVGVPAWFLVAALGTKFGVFDWRFGFGTMTFSLGSNVLFAGLIVGVVSLVVVLAHKLVLGNGFGGFVAPLLAIVVAAGGMGYGAHVRETASGVPPIHDITTDTQNPPEFTDALVARRGEGANTVEYEGKRLPDNPRFGEMAGRLVSELQAQAYPDIQPVRLDVSPELAYEAALGVARDMGWRVTTASDENLVFEGTDETFWFGFKDDIAVRVTEAEDGGSIVDARSISRVGLSDLGKNAARLRAFFEQLRESVDGAGEA